MARRLTAKQELFVHFYLEFLNATRAAKEAGYKGSYSTLGVVGHDNLRKPKIMKAIAEGMKEKAMPKEEILARLSLMAKGELYTKKTKSPKGEWEDYDTKGATESLAKIEKMIEERVEHSGAIELRFQVQYGNPDDADDQSAQPPRLAAPDSEQPGEA